MNLFMEEMFLELLTAVVSGKTSMNDAEALFKERLRGMKQKDKDRAFAEVSNATGRVTQMVTRLHGCFREAAK